MNMFKKPGLPILIATLLVVSVLAACATASAETIVEHEAAAAQSSGETIVLYVGPTLVDCVGASPQKCMLVKQNPEDDYQYFYDQIEGFDYEEGYEYQLLVNVQQVENPPADASSLKFTLVEMVEKTPVDAAVGTGESAGSHEGTLWVLQSYANVDGETVSVLPNTRVTAEFLEGQVAGDTGCNRYFGTYVLDGSNLTVELGGVTMRACPGLIMTQEKDFLDALASSATYAVDGEQLEISNTDGDVVLTFAADQPLSLTGTPWQLISFNTGNALLSSLTTELITAEFGEDGNMTGFAGCNNYTARYRTKDDSIEIGPAATTRKMCAEPQDVMETEAGYLAALERAASYQIEGIELTLLDQDGTRVAIYRASGETAEVAPDTEVIAPAVPVAEPTPEVVDTYHALLPSADSRGRVVELDLMDDGSATLIIDYLNDEPPIVETGTWQANDDGTVTLTLLAIDDRALNDPDVITFETDGDNLRAVDYDAELYGSAGLPLSRQGDYHEQIEGAKRAFLILDLEAGFPLDPFFVSVNGGGELDASTYVDGCTGFVHKDPIVSVDWEGETDFIEVFFYSDHDPTLIIQKPDGSFVCNDDANALLLDPVVEMANPEKGIYNIWVGSYHENQLIPGVLVITTRPDVNIGTFTLDGLVSREAIPEVLQTPEGRKAAEELLAMIEARQGDIEKLTSGSEPKQVDITAEGDVAAFEFDIEGAICNGHIGEIPDYVFDWSGTDPFAVYFEGNQDATLVLVQPGGAVVCNDDAVAGENLNPYVVLEQPPEGLYAIFVGRIDPETPVTGQLTIAGIPDADVDVLEPAGE
ncbi:MAG: META domain-containing protein [Chloroflexota bacterium]|nr:META domain-containing protein [Chloroflexota bacterium]